MRICVYGAGAMGTSLGALLERSGVACELVSRNREHIAALQKRGAVLIIGNAETVTPVTALLPEEMSGTYDMMILATGQRANRETAEFLKPFLKADGALVSVQNGLPERSLADVVGADRVYGCVLSWGAELAQAGAVRITSESGFHLALGAYGAGTRLNEIAAVFEKAGETSTGNLNEIRFAKLAVNASFSTLSAISGLTFGELSKKYKKYATKLIRDVFSVARASGCKKLPLNGHDLFRVFGRGRARLTLPIAMKKYRNTRSGMLKDLSAGRRCDVDFVAGAAVNAGEMIGVTTRYLKRAVALVHDIENGFAEIAPQSLALLKQEREDGVCV